jgi:Zn-dependent peptidase ImmA (M78 family)
MVRRQLVRSEAARLLRSSKIHRAPVPVLAIARSLGAEVRRQPADEELSGFLLREESSGTTIIGVNDTHHRHRQRFTVAHEIGHMLLHRQTAIHVDSVEAIFRIDLRDERSSLGVDDDEKEANLFAAELLMPGALLKKDLSGPRHLNDETIRRLARQYDVSVLAMTYRLTYLDYLPTFVDLPPRRDSGTRAQHKK